MDLGNTPLFIVLVAAESPALSAVWEITFVRWVLGKHASFRRWDRIIPSVLVSTVFTVGFMLSEQANNIPRAVAFWFPPFFTATAAYVSLKLFDPPNE